MVIWSERNQCMDYRYCCEGMKVEGWYIQVKDNKITLQEEFSAHYMDNVTYCPWCGKKLKDVVNFQFAENGEETITLMSNDKIEQQLKTKDMCFELIYDIAVDYDGCRSAKELMELIDEIANIAHHGRTLKKQNNADMIK